MKGLKWGRSKNDNWLLLGFDPRLMRHPLDLIKTEPNQALILVFVGNTYQADYQPKGRDEGSFIPPIPLRNTP